jgi:cytochrome d ubiquinol oxidase subunit I
MPDVETLARLQFAMTTVFHFFFVPLSIGLCVMTVIFEGMYVKTKNELYKDHAVFWGKFLTLSFAVGVVTGIIQEFQFGMNWSEYSRFVGDIFGVPLAIEALLAFFLESTFLGVWMFTWDKVKPKLHFLFVCLVALGSILSSFWILLANSFMQHPGKEGVVYDFVTGKNGVKHAVLKSFTGLFSPDAFWEIAHVLTATLIMGGMIVAGISAWQLFMKRNPDFFRKSMKIGLIVLTVGAVATLVTGDREMADIARADGQPMKYAALDGVYDDEGKPLNGGTSYEDYANSKDSAAMTAVAFFNESEHKQIWGIKIPYMMSIMSYHKPTGAIKGMNTVNQELVKKYGADNYYPMVTALFWNFRIMAGTAMAFLAIGVLGLIGTTKKFGFILNNKFAQVILFLCTFLPFLSNSAGWLITELGRQPWTVYGLFKTKDSVSPNVTALDLAVSNIVYFVLFASLAITMFALFAHIMKNDRLCQNNDPDYGSDYMDPFAKEAISK